MSPLHAGGSLKARHVSPLLLNQGLFWHRNIPEHRAGWMVQRRLDRQNGGPTLEEGRKKSPHAASLLGRCVIN